MRRSLKTIVLAINLLQMAITSPTAAVGLPELATASLASRSVFNSTHFYAVPMDLEGTASYFDKVCFDTTQSFVDCGGAEKKYTDRVTYAKNILRFKSFLHALGQVNGDYSMYHKDTLELVGFFTLDAMRSNNEIVPGKMEFLVFLSPEYRGKGYGKEITQAGLGYAGQYLGMSVLLAPMAVYKAFLAQNSYNMKKRAFDALVAAQKSLMKPSILTEIIGEVDVDNIASRNMCAELGLRAENEPEDASSEIMMKIFGQRIRYVYDEKTHAMFKAQYKDEF